MLILVMVTIRISKDGGLFTTTRKAARDTEEQAIYDQIVNAMELNENGKIKPRDTFESFKSNFGENKIQEKNGNTASKIVFTVKGARDTYTYTITENEIIIGEIKEPNDYDILKTYFLGADGNGRNLDDILDEDENWKDDPTTDVDETSLGINISYGYEGATTESYIIKYNNAIYELTSQEMEDPAHPGDSTYYYTKSIELNQIYKQNLNSREGKDLGQVTGDSQYNGWTILYDNGSYVEAVSPSAMGELQLGSDKDQQYGDSEESNAEYDKAITSYDTAIETINNYCKSLSNLPTNNGIRSVGAEVDTTTTYANLDPLNNGWANNRGFEIKNRGKDSDQFYKQDAFRMLYYNILSGGKDYWFASREYYKDRDYFFALSIMETNEDEEIGVELRETGLFELDYNMSFPRAFSYTHAVRPIIKVEI